VVDAAETQETIQITHEMANATTTIDKADTAWMLTSSALVLMMTIPGLFLFYGGLVRAKNALNIIMHSFIIAALISVQWVLWGYSLAFGPDHGGIIGSLSWFGLNGVGIDPNPDYAATIPHQAFMVFQLMFAIITPALITGAFAERAKFSTFILFILLWTTFIYDPLAHWVWGVNGWLRRMGALDFAGGTVVHISSGISALAAALMFGKRVGYRHEAMRPHNLPFSVIGASMLWVGWFGFNAGSALMANGLATSAFVVTNTATAAAVLSWMIMDWLFKGKPTVLGAASGAVAGLVAITPASGFVGPMSSIIIGMGAGILCFTACNMKIKLGYDDSLDVVGVHGVGGIWGSLATGLFASKAINPAGNNGLFFGNPGQLWVQFVTVAVTCLFAFVATLVILSILKVIIGLRVSIEEELEGLDISEHGEVAYPGFQIIHSIGSSEIKALEDEMEKVEKRKEKIMSIMGTLRKDRPKVAAELKSFPIGFQAEHREEKPSVATFDADKQPFRIIIENARVADLKKRWAELCNLPPQKTPPEFQEVYKNLASREGNTFSFYRGDPETLKQDIEKLFKGYTSMGMEVKVEK
jgi:Amt family ammonium transporter